MGPRTSDQMRKSRERWLGRKPEDAPAWPLVDKAVEFQGDKATPDGRYVVMNGRLVVTTPPEGRCIQQLWTTDEFDGDFVLKLDFRATPNADSGVFVRGRQSVVFFYWQARSRSCIFSGKEDGI